MAHSYLPRLLPESWRGLSGARSLGRGGPRFLIALMALYCGSLLLGGCQGPAGYDPAAKLHFMRRHGTSLTPQQVAWLKRVPYRSSRQMSAQMQQILMLGESSKIPLEKLGMRQSVTGLPREQEHSPSEDKQSREEVPLDP